MFNEMIGNWSELILGTLDRYDDLIKGKIGSPSYKIDSMWEFICFAIQKLEKEDIEQQVALVVLQSAIHTFLQEEFQQLAGQASEWNVLNEIFREQCMGINPDDKTVSLHRNDFNLYFELNAEGIEKLKIVSEAHVYDELMKKAGDFILLPGFDAYGLMDWCVELCISWLKKQGYDLADMQEILQYYSGSERWMTYPEYAEVLVKAVHAVVPKLLEKYPKYTRREIAWAMAQGDCIRWEPEDIEEDWIENRMIEYLETAICDLDLEEEEEDWEE